MKVFIPFSESLVEELGSSLGELVPFNLAYECLHVQEVVTPVASDQNPQPAKTKAQVVHLDNVVRLKMH